MRRIELERERDRRRDLSRDLLSAEERPFFSASRSELLRSLDFGRSFPSLSLESRFNALLLRDLDRPPSLDDVEDELDEELLELDELEEEEELEELKLVQCLILFVFFG